MLCVEKRRFVRTCANIDMFLAEEKWSALNGRQQFCRSVMAHSVIATTIALLAGMHGDYSNSVADRTFIRMEINQHSATVSQSVQFPARTLQFSPVSTPIEDRTKASADLTPNMIRPEGTTEKPPEMTSPTTRPGPPLKTPLLTGSNDVHMTKQPNKTPLPVKSASSSPTPSESSKGPSKTPLSLVSNGAGNKSFGAPDRPDSRPAQDSRTSASMVDLPPRRVGPRQRTFAELDRQACQAFYRGETIASSNAQEAKQLWQKAVALMDEALPLLALEQGAENAEMASALRNVGRCYDRLNQPDKSCEYHKNSAAMYKKLEGSSSKEFGISLVFYADALINQGDFSKAEAPLKESLPIYEQTYGDKSQYVAWTYQRLAKICNHTERPDEAERFNTLANSILNK